MSADASNGRSGRGVPSAGSGRIGWIAVGVALVTVFVVIGIGALRVISREGADRAGAAGGSGDGGATSPHESSPSGQPGDLIVDIRTGKTTALPATIASVDRVADYQVSPDGTRMAFTGPGVDDEYRQIYVAGIEGGRPVRITKGPIPISSPRWSPDGTKIVYEALSPPDGSDLYVVDVETPPVRRTSVRLAHGSDSQLWRVGAAPSFSPDGRTVLFTKARGDGRTDLWIVPLAGGRPQILIEDAAFGSFSPDGRTIAYQHVVERGSEDAIWLINEGIWLADADGSHRVPLPIRDRAFDRHPRSWKHLGPLWSPDGTKISYVHPDDGNVYVADVSSLRTCCSAMRSLSRIGPGGWPSWFDDDRLIVEGYGGAAPAFTLADLAGIWFTIDRGDPLYLLIGNAGNYALEYRGGVGSSIEQSGNVEVDGDTVRFEREGGTDRCADDSWDLRSVSLSQPGRMRASDGVCRNGLLGGRPTTWRLVDDRLRIPGTSDEGSVPVRRSDVVGTWVSGGTFYRFDPDGAFGSYWAEPDWPYQKGFESGEAGRWTLRDDRLQIMYARGRMCPGPGGVMGLGAPTFDDRAHRLEVSRVLLERPGVLSLATVRDDCFHTVGDRDLRMRLFPKPKAFESVVTLATQETSFGDPWKVETFRDVMGELLCIGEPDRAKLCGPEDDPAAGWISGLDRPLKFVDRQLTHSFTGMERSGWGTFASPIVSVKAAERDLSGDWYPTDATVVDLPARFGQPFRLFLVYCDCTRLRIVGLDAVGREVASMRL